MRRQAGWTRRTQRGRRGGHIQNTQRPIALRRSFNWNDGSTSRPCQRARRRAAASLQEDPLPDIDENSDANHGWAAAGIPGIR